MTNWIKYAQWEESQNEFERWNNQYFAFFVELFLQRARSICERAIDEDARCVTVWLKYAEMEMK